MHVLIYFIGKQVAGGAELLLDVCFLWGGISQFLLLILIADCYFLMNQ